jgi:hypothetical protein
VSEIVKYTVDDGTEVRFEIDPAEGFHKAGANGVLGRVQDAVRPAVDAAGAVLDQVKELRPDEIEVRLGVKVSGEASWLVARAASEGSFEIKLTWRSTAHEAAQKAAGPE